MTGMNRSGKLVEKILILTRRKIEGQGCHVSGKCQGKTKFSPGQGKDREF